MATYSYVIADTHLAHPNAAKFRGMVTVDTHDRMVVDGINSVVNPTDNLYILGDVVISRDGWNALREINCRNLILVPGNHCGERTRIRTSMFRRIQGTYDRILPDSRIRAAFTHIPIHPNCLDRWDVNVHGHLHGESIDDPRFLCVSCEQLNFKPISMQEIQAIFESRGIYGPNKAI